MRGRRKYPVVRLDVELDLLACEGSDSIPVSCEWNGDGKGGEGRVGEGGEVLDQHLVSASRCRFEVWCASSFAELKLNIWMEGRKADGSLKPGVSAVGGWTFRDRDLGRIGR